VFQDLRRIRSSGKLLSEAKNNMPMSRKTEIAQARRHLRRIEEDESRLRMAINGFSEDAKKIALRWYYGIVERQREYLRKLEDSK